jgi:hypothetical protein
MYVIQRDPKLTVSGCLTIRNLVGYDSSDLRPVSSLMSQILPQCPPDLTLIEGELNAESR